jgi:hypothetical protein
VCEDFVFKILHEKEPVVEDILQDKWYSTSGVTEVVESEVSLLRIKNQKGTESDKISNESFPFSRKSLHQTS